MIPSDIRLYTWVDVQEVLLRKQQKGDWPKWLVWAQVYWDDLTMGICPGTQAQAKDWLREIYDPRFQNDAERDASIVLESLSDNQRTLPVYFEETEEEPLTPRLTPSLSRPTVLWSPGKDVKPPDVLPSDLPPVVAFHSFKGGVGRTTHAIALAEAFKAKKRKVLLVDGDLEAPGISWLFEKRFPKPLVSFSDLLALAHGDSSPNSETAIQLVADRLADSQVDGIYILPSFRNNAGFTSLEIRPEHLISGSKNPFLLTDILAKLAKNLGVDVVLVDLRAGLSELSTGLILDPRVYRIFVTTLSAQSISGTVRLLELIAERSPSRRDEDPLPALIITQVPEDERLKDLIIEPESELLEAAKTFLEGDRELVRIITGFFDGLLVLPSSWEEVTDRLRRLGIVESLQNLIDWLPEKPVVDRLPEQQVEPIAERIYDIKLQREKVAELAGKLIYAETAEMTDFLATNPLRHLVSDRRRQVPIAVIVGAKGAGKTYTFLQIVRRETWQDFARDVSASEVSDNYVNALISPLIEPQNIEPNARDIVEKVRSKSSKLLGFEDPQAANKIRDYIRNSLDENLHEGRWRDRWLDLIAWSVGCQPQTEGAIKALIAHLINKKQQLVIAIDGLEDAFQQLNNDKNQQTALRALLQEVPEWLGQQPGRPLGIIIFVRRDMVLASIHQNAAQMMALYQSYALKWNWEEALRLVTWVTKKAGVLPEIDIDRLQDMNKEELTQALVPLWGKKLGSDRSREARSDRFVIAALSDYNGQIQSRDLVRLLHLAAQKSVDDTRWQDRVLVPQAIKNALPECSKSKIDEIKQENQTLRDIFNKWRQLRADSRRSPFTQKEANVSVEEIDSLEYNGAIIREGGKYYLAEIYRLGLEFSQNAGRAKVIALARRAGLDI